MTQIDKVYIDDIRMIVNGLIEYYETLQDEGVLDTTLANTDKLKRTYKIVEKKVVDILGELLNYQSNLFKQTGNIYSTFSGETMSEMVLLTDYPFTVPINVKVNGFDYKKRVLKLHDRVVNELSGNKLGLLNHYE